MNKTATTPKDQVRASLDSWHSSMLAQDLDKVLSMYTRDLVSYDAILKLQIRGLDAYAAHWNECMAFCPSDMIFEIHDPEISVDGDLALVHFLARCGGTNEEGQEETGWMRTTQCWRRNDGDWKIAHEHLSIPFDPKSGQMLHDATP